METAREKKIRDLIAKLIPRESDQDELWRVIDDVVDEERWEAKQDGAFEERRANDPSTYY